MGRFRVSDRILLRGDGVPRRRRGAERGPYVTPEEPDSCWKSPGPAAGPCEARLGDGSVVTYWWYRFADQPAMLNADLTPAEREAMQAKVEKLHRAWTKDRDYLAPPTVGKLAAIETQITDTRERPSGLLRVTATVAFGSIWLVPRLREFTEARLPAVAAAVDTFGNPGGNVGELLQRLPGISVDIGQGGEPGGIYVRGMTQDFSSLMVDGNQIAVSGGTTVSKGNVYFGNVTTSNVSSIEVIKAPLPDQDGNAVAGYINVRTKRAFESAPGRDIGLTVGTNWVLNHFDESVPGKDKPGIDLINLTYREVFSVFGGRNNLGVSANATFSNIHMTTGEFGISQVANYNDAMFAFPAVGGNPVEPLQRAIFAGNLDANSTGSWTKTGGFNIDYKLNPDTVLYFKSTYQRINRSSGAVPAYFRWKLSVPKNKTSFDPTSTYNLVKTYGVGTVDVLAMNYIKETELYSLASGVERRLWQGSGLLNVDANYSSNRTSYIIENINTQLPSGVGYQLSRRGHDFWTPELTQTAGPDWTNPANYIFRPDSSSNSPYEQDKYRAPAERWGYRIDLKKDFATKYPSYLKVGIKSDEFRQFAERGVNLQRGPLVAGLGDRHAQRTFRQTGVPASA